METVSQGVQVGIDIGQRVDPSAIVVAEIELRDGIPHYIARLIERLPIGTPYPQVAGRAAQIMTRLKAQGHRARCFMDATGVGKPIVDMLHAAGVPAIPVFLTGGKSETFENGEIRLSKALLVTRLQILLQNQHIHLPDTTEAEVLVRELMHYEIRITAAANIQAGAFGGKHDDLATALGLACRDYRPFNIEFV